MFSLFRRPALGKTKEAEFADPFVPSVGDSVRVYAIGDIHGRRDLLNRLLETIIADCEERGTVEQLRIVLLGDLVDRGADSSGVVNMVMTVSDYWSGITCLMGNHEEMFLLALGGDVYGLSMFRRIGRETLLSYGIDGAIIDEGTDSALFEAMMIHVPEAHRDFLRTLPNSLVIGDYLFVHAGIKPGVALEDQDHRDLRWIRGKFLTSQQWHGHMVVHGHTITEFVDEQPNRIGIDTGAYASDRLTAIGLEGQERWYLST